MKEGKTFLEGHPWKDSFEHLLLDQLLTEKPDGQRIKSLKDTFLLVAKNRNNEAKELLRLIEKVYQKMDAQRKFRDWLMNEAYWQLPDMKTIATDHYPEHDKYRPTMLQTKFWIMEQVIRDWNVGLSSREITEASISTFRFLIAAFNPLSKKHCPDQRQGESEFELKARGRKVSQEEKDKILKLLRGQDVVFKPKELEFWISQPHLPIEFERTLAIARTREGGHNLWRNDIRNAELVKPFSPDERTKAAIDLYERYGDIIAGIDRKGQKLLKQMRAGSWSKSEEIGASEYVLGEIELIYHNLFEIITNIVMESKYSEALVQNNFARAEGHIQKWLRQNHSQNRSYKVILNMSGGKTDLKLNTEFYGDRYKG